MKKSILSLKPTIILMFLVFISIACTATSSTNVIELATVSETPQPQQMTEPPPAESTPTTEPAPAESSPTPEPTFQGQYETGAVEILETDQDLVVAQCQSVTSAFDERAYGTGWVQIISPRIWYINQPGESYGDTLVTERWYRMDQEGYAIEGFAWVSTLEGEVQQEIVYLNGWYDEVYRSQWFNLDFDSFGPEGEIQGPTSLFTDPVRFTASFCDKLAEQDSPQVAVVSFAGVETLRFSFEDQYTNTYGQEVDLFIAQYFERSTGTHLGGGTYEILPDDQLKAVSGTVDLQYVFNADPPEERFAEIWGRVPHKDSFVPLEEGEP